MPMKMTAVLPAICGFDNNDIGPLPESMRGLDDTCCKFPCGRRTETISDAWQDVFPCTRIRDLSRAVETFPEVVFSRVSERR